MTTRRIHTIELHDYMKFCAKTYTFTEHGGIIAGQSDDGKTTVLRAIRDCLIGRGIDQSAVRIGAESAEVIVDLGDVTVRRVIKANGKPSTLTVKIDDVAQKSPATVLRDILGLCPLDPLEFLTEQDPAKRKAYVLAALPVKATHGLLRAWLPDVNAADISAAIGVCPSGNADDEVPGHGLEVAQRLREHFYDKRTEARRIAKEATAAVGARAQAVAEAQATLTSCACSGTTFDMPAAEAWLAEAKGRIATLERQQQAATDAAARNQATLKRMAEWRAEAQRIRDTAPEGVLDAAFEEAEAAINDAERAEDVARARVDELRALLNEAERDVVRTSGEANEARMKARALRARRNAAEAASKRAVDLEERAAEVEAAVATLTAPSADEFDAARGEVAFAQASVERLECERELALAVAAQTQARQAANAADFELRKLDRVVHVLTHDAPKQLLASVGLEGLSIEGDNIVVDGVSLDRLSGARSMEVAVRIAKAMNAKTKLLLVDGLERLDPERRAEFVKLATEGGYQLIATCVAAGPAHLEPIE